MGLSWVSFCQEICLIFLIWGVNFFERFASLGDTLENGEMVEKYQIIMVCCMSRINYLVLLISQKDYEPIRFF